MKRIVYRYYTRLRPPMPGGIPKEGLICTASYDWPQSFSGQGVWGWAEYDRILADKEISDYELVPARNNPLVYE